MRIKVLALAAMLICNAAVAAASSAPAAAGAQRFDPARPVAKAAPGEPTCKHGVCAGFVETSDVTILSADGCNSRVCIHVRGTGLKVDKWWTTAQTFYSDGRICNPTAFFEAKGPNSTIYYVVDQVTIYECHQANGYWYAFFEGGGSSTWQDGTRLGNAWHPNPPLSGFPTELVHK
jgi:hypothetical protein